MGMHSEQNRRQLPPPFPTKKKRGRVNLYKLFISFHPRKHSYNYGKDNWAITLWLRLSWLQGMHHFVDIHSSFFFLLHKQQHNRNRATHIYFLRGGGGWWWLYNLTFPGCIRDKLTHTK